MTTTTGEVSTDLIENIREHAVSIWPLRVPRSGFWPLPTEHVREIRKEVRRRRRVGRTLLLGFVYQVVLHPSFWVRQDEIRIGHDL